jgi:16S rRNA (guanine527-N7)-methyltransferase
MDFSDFNVPRGTIEKYIELLKIWNKKINLIKFKDEEELVTRHILDSIQIKKFISPDEVVFDIGSGAGFPGIILSFAGIKQMNLVEVIGKKSDFLTVASSLSQNKIKVYNQDIKTIQTDRCDVITARGLASLEEIFELSSNLYKGNTRFILLKGKNLHHEIKIAIEKWNFEYIIHKSETSSDGYILEVKNLSRNEQSCKNHCHS